MSTTYEYLSQCYTTFPSERQVLMWLCTHVPGRRFVEIGAREGRTTAWLAPRLLAEGWQYWVIDPWDGTQDGAGLEIRAAFDVRTAGLNIEVVPKRAQAVTPPDGIGVVFHDGDHRDPDVDRWWKALEPGNILAVHDFFDPGWPQVRAAMLALGPPWHEYRYQPTVEEPEDFGPSPRGLAWKVKP